jgi:hypothetical protein
MPNQNQQADKPLDGEPAEAKEMEGYAEQTPVVAAEQGSESKE